MLEGSVRKAGLPEQTSSKALLDCRNMTGEIQIFSSFTVAEYGVKMAGIISKTALIGREDQMLHSNFVENVAINRGVNLKIFTDADEAIDWLKEQSSN